MISFRWEWNLEGVEFENALSNTVVEAVASKIQTLPEKLQRALVIAAYTRSSIELETLRALMIADGFDLDLKELVGLMDIAVLEGLLFNTVGSSVYKFAHDRIQQAAYWLVPSGKERDELRILIGKKLVELAYQPIGKEWMIFVAADHVSSLFML
jgi:predicted ATPase